jgi:hypothetical protein
MASLLDSARRDLGDTVPFDLALYFVRRHNDSHAHANPCVFNIGAAVAKEYMLDASYYGQTTDIVFIHVPRRLRLVAVQAAASRIDPNRTAIAVVVPPQSRTLALPSSDLLANLEASLEGAGILGQTLFIALDRDGFDQALALAPFRVVLAGEGGTHPTLGASEPMISSAAVAATDALSTVASFADAGVSLLVIGPSAVAGRSSLSLALAALNVTDTDTLWLQARTTAPLVATDDPCLLDVGAMVIPGTKRASSFIGGWASAVARGDQWTRTAAGITAAVAERCSMGELPMLDPSSPAPSCAGLQTATLPAELYLAAPSLQHPLWSAAGRRAVAALVTASPDPGTAALHLRQVGLWQAGASTAAVACSNYSAAAYGRLPIGDLATTHRSLSSYAAFLRFASQQNLACGVLPGFAVASAGGHAVPYDAVLHRTQVTGLVPPDMLVVPHITDFGELPYEAFVSAQGRGGALRLRLAKPPDFGHAHERTGAPGRRSTASRASHLLGPALDGTRRLSGTASSPSATATAGAGATALHQPSSVLGNACAAFNLSGTACLAPAVAADVATAVRAWQRLQAGPLQCMLDARRTRAEVAVLGLEGRLGEVRDVAAAMLGPGAKAATVLMTGAWRALPAKAFRGDNATASGLTFITMADLASSRQLTSASDADVPFMSPDEAAGLSPLADIVEYALCQGHAVAVHDLGEGLPPSPSPVDLAVRVAAHIPPDRLAVDLDIFTTWLARPDRPGLGGRMLWARWPATGTSNISDAIDGVVSALQLAEAVDVPLVGLSAAWSAAFYGNPKVHYALHTAARNLIPPSITVMLDPARAVDALKGWSSPTTPVVHSASADAVLADPRYAAAWGAVQRVLLARAWNARSTDPLYVSRPRDGGPWSRRRVRSWRPLVRANTMGLVMDFGAAHNETRRHETRKDTSKYGVT